MVDNVVVIRGGGDIATGIAYRLHRCGFKVLVLEIEKPLVVRVKVAFAQALIDGEIVVEEVKAVKAQNIDDIHNIWNSGDVPVIVDSDCQILNEIKPIALVDATLAKKNLGTHKGMVPITIGVGPGFEAKKDVDAVVETLRGNTMGRVIYDGKPIEDTKVPGKILGYGYERVLRAPCDGIIRNVKKIGDIVNRGDEIAFVNNLSVKAEIDGVLRGLITNGMKVSDGLKVGDVDPTKKVENCYIISDKARAVGGGVVEAILYLKRCRGINNGR